MASKGAGRIAPHARERWVTLCRSSFDCTTHCLETRYCSMFCYYVLHLKGEHLNNLTVSCCTKRVQSCWREARNQIASSICFLTTN